MKTTLDLPDKLYRAAKARAAAENRRVKDVVAEALATGMQRNTDPDSNGPSPEAVDATIKALDAIANGPRIPARRIRQLMKDATARRKDGWNREDLES